MADYIYDEAKDTYKFDSYYIEELKGFICREAEVDLQETFYKDSSKKTTDAEVAWMNCLKK